jgi:hypothetical protein
MLDTRKMPRPVAEKYYSATGAKWWAVAVLITGTGLICIWTNDKATLFWPLLIVQAVLMVAMRVIISRLRDIEYESDSRRRLEPRLWYHGVVWLAFLLGIIMPTVYMYMYTADLTPYSSRTVQQPTPTPTVAPLLETSPQETTTVPEDEVVPPRTPEPEPEQPISTPAPLPTQTPEPPPTPTPTPTPEPDQPIWIDPPETDAPIIEDPPAMSPEPPENDHGFGGTPDEDPDEDPDTTEPQNGDNDTPEG